MSKRKRDDDDDVFPQTPGITLCDDVILMIVNLMLGKPSLERHFRNDKNDAMNTLETYFSFPLINKAFNRVILTNKVEWKNMLEERYREKEAITEEIARIFVYHEVERRRLNNFIDAIVLKENVTYRSPVQKVLSKDKLSHKKLRNAKYPSNTIKNTVLDALRKYERLCKADCSMRKTYLKGLY